MALASWLDITSRSPDEAALAMCPWIADLLVWCEDVGRTVVDEAARGCMVFTFAPLTSM